MTVLIHPMLGIEQSTKKLATKMKKVVNYKSLTMKRPDNQMKKVIVKSLTM
jgi:hypothetical protein